MANYIVQNCDFEGLNWVVSSDQILNPNDIISFVLDSEELILCGTVLSGTVDAPEATFVKFYSDCETCRQDFCTNKFFTFAPCNETGTTLTAIVFVTYFPLGTYVQICDECYQVISNDSGDTPSLQIITLPTFESCEDCEQNKYIHRTLTDCNSEETGDFGCTSYFHPSIQEGDAVVGNISSYSFFCAIAGPISLSGDTFSIPHLVVTNIGSCDECNNTKSVSLIELENCDTEEITFVVPDVYTDFLIQKSINIGDPIIFSRGAECYTIIDSNVGFACLPDYPFYRFDSSFTTCEECNQPLSGGSEYIGCYTCSGDTQTVELPHPTWTNLSGKAVVMMDAVVLGGINGLNS
jgi:hypothetical protein